MAQQGFNFQRLVRQLGLKNVSELPVVEALTPVIIAGDGGDLVAPLIPPQAWSGRELSAVVAEHGAFQIHAIGNGGIYADVWFGRGRGAGEVDFKLRIDPADPLTVDPVTDPGQIFNTGPIPITSLFTSGTTTVAPSGLTPSFPAVQLAAGPNTPVLGIFVPVGFRITVQCDVPNQPVLFAAFWKEMPPNLTPDG